VSTVVRLPEPPAVPDDCIGAAKRTPPRHLVQRNYPGSKLQSASGDAIKRITAGVKARRWPSPA